MDVYWLEQSEADVPAADDWLSEREVVQLGSFRFAKRRADWRLGRWTAKLAVAASLKLADSHRSLTKIEINAAAAGQPEVTLAGRTDQVTISISHRNGVAICAVATGNVQLGCDLEAIESRDDNFVSDYFTPEEQELIAQMDGEKRASLITLLWSAKESALKALHLGLRVDTRSVRVEIPGSPIYCFGDVAGPTPKVGSSVSSADVASNEWLALQIRCADGALFHGWWQCRDNTVRTIAAAPPPATPRELRHHDVERHQQATALS